MGNIVPKDIQDKADILFPNTDVDAAFYDAINVISKEVYIKARLEERIIQQNSIAELLLSGLNDVRIAYGSSHKFTLSFAKKYVESYCEYGKLADLIIDGVLTFNTGELIKQDDIIIKRSSLEIDKANDEWYGDLHDDWTRFSLIKI